MQLKSTIFGNAPICQCGKEKQTTPSNLQTDVLCGALSIFPKWSMWKGQKKKKGLGSTEFLHPNTEQVNSSVLLLP